MHHSKEMCFHFSKCSPNLSIGFEPKKNDFSIYFPHKPNIVSPILINQQALKWPNSAHWYP
jgi:hypothetical protein